MPNRKRKCRNCKEYGDAEKGVRTPKNDWFCSTDCTATHIINKRKKEHERKVKKAAEKEKQKHIKRKKDFLLNDVKTQKRKARDSCHRFIRLRDEKLPCISCGRYDHQIPDVMTGGKWDAGHFRTRASMPELRYEEINIHKQCKSCNSGDNQFTKKGMLIAEQYRKNLIERIGIEKVIWLETNSNHILVKQNCEYLIGIQEYYNRKIKELSII